MTKSQTPGKIPILNLQIGKKGARFGHFHLMFGDYLGFGAWDLGFLHATV
jgi:hypothetical protein